MLKLLICNFSSIFQTETWMWKKTFRSILGFKWIQSQIPFFLHRKCFFYNVSICIISHLPDSFIICESHVWLITVMFLLGRTKEGLNFSFSTMHVTFMTSVRNTDLTNSCGINDFGTMEQLTNTFVLKLWEHLGSFSFALTDWVVL